MPRQFYPLGDPFFGDENRRFTMNDQHNLRAIKTGEFRPPMAGEWYLSGAIPSAYKTPGGFEDSCYHIVKIVEVEVTTTTNIVIK